MAARAAAASRCALLPPPPSFSAAAPFSGSSASTRFMLSVTTMPDAPPLASDREVAEGRREARAAHWSLKTALPERYCSAYDGAVEFTSSRDW